MAWKPSVTRFLAIACDDEAMKKIRVNSSPSTFSLTPASVRNWEAGATQPYGVARILLAIIATHPEVVDEVLRVPKSARSL